MIVGRWIILADGVRARVLAHQFVLVTTNQLLNQQRHASCALIEHEDGTLSTGAIDGCKLEQPPSDKRKREDPEYRCYCGHAANRHDAFGRCDGLMPDGRRNCHCPQFRGAGT